VIGMVLAAGAGRRLAPYTETLPKTLVPVDGERTVLDIALANLRAAGLQDVVIVTGYRHDAVEQRVGELEERHDVRLELVFNDKAEEWNNAYSLWVAREHLRDGALLVNGDTVHPPSVEQTLLAARGRADIVLAVDREKPLGEEEMKIHLDGDGFMDRINKSLDPASAAGEYIGLTLIEAAAAEPLAEALEATWERDPNLYYEDGYQEFVDRGGRIATAPIGAVEWVEVDDHADLQRARLGVHDVEAAVQAVRSADPAHAHRHGHLVVSAVGPDAVTGPPAPAGEDADPKECLWHFERSRTTPGGDRRAREGVRVPGRATQSTMSTRTRLWSLTADALTSVRSALAVRPPRPMIRP